MKRAFIGFFNTPLLVIVVSVLIAGSIGVTFTMRHNAPAALQLATATAGTIVTSTDQTGSSTDGHLTLAFLTGGRIASVSVKAGDSVTTGQTLATLDPGNTLGARTQAQAALEAAQASYAKLLNGATPESIAVAQTAVHTAEVSLEQTQKQQDVLVQNAHDALLNVSPEAYPQNPKQVEDTPPTISGSYALNKKGQIVVTTYPTAAHLGVSYKYSGLVSGIGTASEVTAQPLGDSGLYIQFPSNTNANRTWVISIPNTKASAYLNKYNAYQTALQRRNQVVATAQAALDQAQSNLHVVTAGARTEDITAAKAQIESAKGALQVAQSAYENTQLTAPATGTIRAVHVTPGQLAIPNAPAVELSRSTVAHDVPVMVPNNAIITRENKHYVQVQTNTGVKETQVTVGVYDEQNTQITAGLSAGTNVVVQQ